jgi:DNA mismatch repair protein MutS2
MGEMRVKVKLKDLVAVREQLDVRNKPTVNTNAIEKSATFDPKLDLRGMTLLDAERVLQNFLDTAMVSSANTLRIVHGKGDGVLRKMVRKKLKEYKEVQKVFHPENFEGGDGVTIVEL